MGDMLNQKFVGGGVPKNIYFLRAISSAETAMIFFDGKGVSTTQKLSNFSKKMSQKTLISAAKKLEMCKVQK